MPTEGALAPDPLARLMPARLETMREIPGRRRREPAWKDEVRQRVSRRRAQRLGMELPLFPDAEPSSALDEDLEMEPMPAPVQTATALLDPPEPEPSEGPRLVWSMPVEDPAPISKAPTLDMAGAPPAPASRWSLGDGDAAEGEDITEDVDPEADGSWVYDDATESADIDAEPRRRTAPVERPAQWTDRVQCGRWSCTSPAARRA
jgi:hypothetical protein